MTDKSDYIARKIAHMKRMGIPAGIGKHGGAAPDWLIQIQREEEKGQMTKIDWTKPIETVKGVPCRVVRVSPTPNNQSEYSMPMVRLPNGSQGLYHRDGTAKATCFPNVRNAVDVTIKDWNVGK